MIKTNRYILSICFLSIFMSTVMRWSEVSSSATYETSKQSTFSASQDTPVQNATVPDIIVQNITTSSQNHHTEYALLNGAPLNIVMEAPGRAWYTLPSLNKIGSLIVPEIASSATTGPQTIDYTIPTVSGEPYDLAYADGFIWFTERQGNQIGRLEIATGQIDEFTIPTPNSLPHGIAIAPNGHIWFTEYATDQIGRFNPVTETFTEYPYIPSSTANSTPLGLTDLAVSRQNILWLTASESDQVIYFDPDANLFYSIPTPAESRPMHIVLDNGGSPWITTANANLVGRYTPGTLSYWYWYEIPIANGSNITGPNVNGPGGIALRDTGVEQQVVFAQPNRGQIGQLELDFSDASLTAGNYRLSENNSQPSGVVIDEDGTIWVADAGTGRIFEWRAPYFSFVYLPMIAK